LNSSPRDGGEEEGGNEKGGDEGGSEGRRGERVEGGCKTGSDLALSSGSSTSAARRMRR
jgi:hypothetical protein